MERLKKVGCVPAKNSKDIKESKVGIGLEKLDRALYDPNKTYDKLAALGVKWIRIQSGWQRTEKIKGVYDFSWIDDIVDNLKSRGMEPWVCLCFGNGLYDENAAKIVGAHGWPPIFTEEQRQAWKNYVKAFVAHFKDRISYFEIWNEPDCGCWKHGINATESGEFTIETAKTIREVWPEAKILGGSFAFVTKLDFINEFFKTGVLDYVDYITFHKYTVEENTLLESTDALRALVAKYNPNVKLIQGESGSQSKSEGHGALERCAWTELKQAKQLARHTIIDLYTDVYFMSYFTTVDVVEATDGIIGDKASYLDYGYFGVLSAEFDEDGFSVGDYREKPSYYTLQTIASLFAEQYEVTKLPVIFRHQDSRRVLGMDLKRTDVNLCAFKKEGGEALCYWYPAPLLTTTFEGTISFELYSDYDTVHLIDILDGSIYEVPDTIMTRDEFGLYRFTHLPITDAPLMLVFGKF